MHSLLLAKFQQHPALARVLLATGDARLHYVDVGGLSWNYDAAEAPTGWAVELVRSQVPADQAGLPATGLTVTSDSSSP